MDGTLIDSSPAVAAAWKLLKETGYEFLDLDYILKSAHGYRTIDALRKWCKIKDEQLLKTEVVRFENAILSNAQAKAGSGGGIIALPGVSQLLDDIEASPDSEHPQGWSVCTSCIIFILFLELILTRFLSDTFLRLASFTCSRTAHSKGLHHRRVRQQRKACSRSLPLGCKAQRRFTFRL